MCTTSLSALHDWFFGYSQAQIFMAGLDYSGKTSILYRMKLGEAISPAIPTCGLNVETVTFKKIRFDIWDFGGGPPLRNYHRRFFTGVQAIMFVVDSTDKDRFGEAREELQDFLNNEGHKDSKILVFNNKCDMPGATSSLELAEHLGMTNITHREWAIRKCSAVTGEGLMEGLEMLYLSIKEAKPMKGAIC